MPANLLLGNSVKINLRYFAQLISSLPLGDKGKKGWPAASYIRLDLLRLRFLNCFVFVNWEKKMQNIKKTFVFNNTKTQKLNLKKRKCTRDSNKIDSITFIHLIIFCVSKQQKFSIFDNQIAMHLCQLNIVSKTFVSKFFAI